MKTTNQSEVNQTKVAFGVWALSDGFLGADSTLQGAHNIISKSRVSHPSRYCYSIHRCRAGWYEKNDPIHFEA